MDATRIADLKRRLQADPTSIAFAQLAEEYRRARQFDEAVVVCREGLARHPGYLSARITLGRALVELGHTTEAEREFEYVLRSAPENLPALRGLAEIHEKQGHLQRALGFYHRALELARYDPDLDETVRAIADALDSSRPRTAGEGLSFEQARQELMEAPSRVPFVPPKPRVDFGEVLQSLGYEPDAPAPPVVEAWLSARPPAPASSVDSPVADPPLRRAEELGPDLLAQLEDDLRQLEQPPAPLPRSETSAPVGGRSPSNFSDADRRVVSSSDQIVIAELERWLEGISRLRADASARQARLRAEASARHARG